MLLFAAEAGFRLPPKSIFPAAMPRYPNVWFYVDARLAGSYRRAVELVTGDLRRAMRLVENRGPLDNPEGCDFEAVIEHLQPWRGADPRLQHAHAFHIRYFFTPLEKAGVHQVEMRGARYYRVAASAHYEVEHTNPNHADVESCSVCGRTGEYSGERGNLVERVHDPLGMELATRGAVRGVPVRHYTGEAIRGLGNTDRYRVEVAVFPPESPEMNTQRIAIVTLRPK